PATGQQEPGVRVSYQFDSNTIKYSLDYYPTYRTLGGRPGNILLVQTTLPKSVAEKLQQGVLRDPKLAREFAKTLALNNGVTDEAWNNITRPPYDQLPDD
ncbi:MAG: hypothetical protein ACREGF_02725, partial [Candidatus Saccharimonadales bacterium]